MHAYHAVIQQLKQQKHELATQQLSERRKAKASDTLSSTVLANLSCGVLFFNTSGLVRQANSAARKLLGFASPVGLACRRSVPHGNACARKASGLVQVRNRVSNKLLRPLWRESPQFEGWCVNHFTRDGESRVFEVTASPVLAEDASLMGTTLVLTDKTDIERIRHDQKLHQEISSELALGLRNSLTDDRGICAATGLQPGPGTGAPVGGRHRPRSGAVGPDDCSFLGGARAATTSS